MLKIPYGIANFKTLRTENYLYVDKTPFIRLLEEEVPYQFLIRPRRFGKSLWVSLLEHYYDLNNQERLPELFDGLAISHQFTPKAAGFLVLRLSFAGVNTTEGKKALMESFDDLVSQGADDFFIRYQNIFQEKITVKKRAEAAIREIIYKTSQAGQQLYILIDEYDNFANDLIGQGNKDLYYELLTSEGYVRTFYKTIKDGTQSAVARIFMTGVSPIMLDDLTSSGFNITFNLTSDPRFNAMMGFTERELENILRQLQLPEEIKLTKLREDLRAFYNGYLFEKDAPERLYNSDMVLYFINHLQSTGKYPEEILDNNVKTDYRKLRELAFGFRDEVDLEKVIYDEEISGGLVERFSLKEMYTEKDNFISLLYYMGMLTIKRSILKGIVFGIPNYVSQKIYWEYFLSNIKAQLPLEDRELRQGVAEMALRGDLASFLAATSRVLEGLSNRDLRKFDEKYIKVLLFTLLQISGVYITISEAETVKGYLDLSLIADRRYATEIAYEWVWELKYLKEKERCQLPAVRQAGCRQLTGYLAQERVRNRFSRQLRAVFLTFVGKKEILVDWVEL